MENQTEPKWFQKPTGAIILLVLFFPVGLYLMWKNQFWTKKTRWIVTVFFGLLAISMASKDKTSSPSSYSDSSSTSNESSSSSNDSYGVYSDFSGWYQGISGKVNVDSSSWAAYILDNGNISNYKGITNGTDLMDEYGVNKLGYLSGDKVYIYYLNGYYPVGR